MISEAFIKKIAAPGEIKWAKSDIKDPHIQKIIKIIASQSGVPVKKVEDEIGAAVLKVKEMHVKAPLLMHTMIENAVENELFHLFEKTKLTLSGSPQFSARFFYELVKKIKREHDQFFPMRNFIDHKVLANENYVMVPTDKKSNMQWNHIPTAAASEHGDFIFNTNFMQKLLDYAHLKGVKAIGKIYKSHGGQIPDEYVYIEFLIIHEYMHYTYADFHYNKILEGLRGKFSKEGHDKIINWVGDFRTNYNLVKSGFAQLPIGLFNDMINYDRQGSYKEMYEKVRDEFEKLAPDDQKEVEDILESLRVESIPSQLIKKGQLVHLLVRKGKRCQPLVISISTPRRSRSVLNGRTILVKAKLLREPQRPILKEPRSTEEPVQLQEISTILSSNLR
jgi:hypothetical protein